jgi:hypothetical protein
MKKTRHFQERMDQRCISDKMVDLALRFGAEDGEKIILNQKVSRLLAEELKAYRKSLFNADSQAR